MRLGVSSCLLGNNCRYDGNNSKDDFVVNQLENYFELVGYCPEEPAFGTPRESMRLVDIENNIKVHLNISGDDVTQKLFDSASNIANNIVNDNLCGFILKSKSPSCGLERVKVYNTKTKMAEKKGIGLFAKELKQKYKYLPIEEDGRLNDAWLKENFLIHVFAYSDFKKFINSNPNMKELVEFHTTYKYLILSKSEKSYKNLGNIVANHNKDSIDLVLKEYEESFLEAIAKKNSIKKTYNVLLHIIGYFKKIITKSQKQHLLNSCEEFKEGTIPLIAVTKLVEHYIIQFNQKYLANQKFIHPYPDKLSLRSDIKAYR